METKHTPGPWRMNGEIGADESKGIAPHLAFYSIRDAKNDYIASTWGDPNEANARLIAAAPEMLEAAKAVTGMLELFIDEQQIKEAADGCARRVEEGAAKLEALRAAIAKAEGR